MTTQGQVTTRDSIWVKSTCRVEFYKLVDYSILLVYCYVLHGWRLGSKTKRLYGNCVNTLLTSLKGLLCLCSAGGGPWVGRTCGGACWGTCWGSWYGSSYVGSSLLTAERIASFTSSGVTATLSSFVRLGRARSTSIR